MPDMQNMIRNSALKPREHTCRTGKKASVTGSVGGLKLLAALLAVTASIPAIAADEEKPRGPKPRTVAPLLQTKPDTPVEDADGLGPVSGDPSIAGPAIPEGAFYGPPRPKAKKGELGSISWNEPGAHVPPALEEAVNLVTANYPSALAARAALKATAADVKAAKWLRFPSISADLQYLDDSNTPEPVLRVSQPIWSGGRLGANIRRAKASEDATSSQYIETVQDLALTTSQTYFEVARLTRREQLLEESVSEHERLVETMQRRVDQEISPIADLELARSRLAQIQQEFTVINSQRLSALRVLAELIADPTYDLGPMPYYDSEAELANPDAFEDQAVAYDPTLQRLYAEADIARADLDTRKASLLPQVEAQYTRSEFIGSRVGVVLRQQTNGGLSQFSEVRSARLQIDSAIEGIRVSEQQLRRDMETLLIQYRAARERASISRSAASTAANVSASYTRQFIAGRRSWLDVMNALREAINAQVGLSESEVLVMSAATQLQLLSGRWRPQFTDPGAYPDEF